MASLLYDISAIDHLLEGGQLVLTPNQRLRNRIREAFAAHHGAVAVTPQVYSLHEWLDQCWQHLQDRAPGDYCRPLINDLQAQNLWKSVIESAETGPPLLANRRLVQQASEALRNLTLWQVPLHQLSYYGGAAEFPLLTWARDYEARLSALQLITREASYERILDAFSRGELPRLPAIYLESLADLPPLLDRLLHAAAERVLPTGKPAPGDGEPRRFAAGSVEEEIRSAALWAHGLLQEQSDCSIGVIVPDLGVSRDQVERIFTETFEPQYYAPAEARYTLPFNISTGTPLGQTPLISTALQLLQFHGAELERFALNKLMNSPFWSDAGAELRIRAAILQTLGRREQSHYSPAEIRSCVQQLAEKDPRGSSLGFSQRLQQLGSLWRRAASAALPGDWVEHFLAVLDVAGWPGSRPLDSVEYQQASQWFQLLERFASLDILEQPMKAGEAVASLLQLARATPFQAEVKQSPIQILGTLEGEGLRFGACWVMGMSNQAWPPRPEPNPLLPLPLQRQLGMPRSSMEKEIRFARELTDHYRHCASAVVFSYPAQVDEAEMLPSPLIAELASASAQDLSLGQPCGLPELYAASQSELEVVDCRYGPPLAVAPGEPVRGGTSVLQQQALCPFNAFARFRLGAEESAAPCLGLSPAEKGSLLHGIMAALWEQLSDLAGLRRNAAQLPALIKEAVAQAFANWKRAPRQLGSYYLHLEQERMEALISRFMELELTREPFAVVAREAELLRDFAGLTFRLRIDRVDRTLGGQHLILDYKTGAGTSSNQWLGERPDEPQLPLYALSYPEPVAGIVFACLRAQEPGFVGIVDEGVSAWDPRIKTPQGLGKQQREDWPTLLEEFRRELERLVTEYREGYAPVQIKHSNAARYNEALRPLNRLPEAEFLAFHLKRPNHV